jgi:hypothetical protein
MQLQRFKERIERVVVLPLVTAREKIPVEIKPSAMRSVACLLLIAGSSFACEGSPPRPPGSPTPRADTGVVDVGGGNNDDGAIADADEPDATPPDAGEDGGIPDSGTPPISIPDPGNANNDWGFGVNDVCCSTPDTAYPTGVVTMDSGYVQGNIDMTTGDFFYVFRAGPALTQLRYTAGLTVDVLDLHDGAGMVFGPVVTPISMGPNTATWPVTPNAVYVLHLHSQTGGFF